MPAREPVFSIRPATAPYDLRTIRRLFEEYQTDIGLDLCFQGFADELQGLPGPYAPPRGRLFLAWIGDTPAGCVALKPIDEGRAELKRLFIRPPFRRCGLARRLVVRIIEDARSIGYHAIYLDTLASMVPAIALYESLGFRRTDAYVFNPICGALYFVLELTQSR